MRTRGTMKRKWLLPIPMVIICSFLCSRMQLLEGKCVPRNGCSVALAYYTLQVGDSLNALVLRFQTTLDDVQRYNSISDPNVIITGNPVLFPFPCECVRDPILGHNFVYNVQNDDTLSFIAKYFGGLTTIDEISQANSLQNSNTLFPGLFLQVPVNCSCGNAGISEKYGLFTTYAAIPTDTITSLAGDFTIGEDVLREYNPSVNWGGNLTTGDMIFIPSREARTRLYPPYNGSAYGSGSSHVGLIVGLSVGGVVALLLAILIPLCLFCICCRRKRGKKGSHHSLAGSESGFSSQKESGLIHFPGAGVESGREGLTLADLTMDKSVEFSFQEIVAATNNFNVANKIGEGGYGAVYLAHLRGQKLAVKRMNLQATREFLSEIQVLTHVHHTNLVQLIGYCTVDSLFLIYEYVENGTLDRHLHGKNNLPPLSWPARVQIALDAARGLEYIHEHTKPTYIHRDVKSSNILIDRQFHAKVADFGLSKLTKPVGGVSTTDPTRLVGTFGYMSPEYARFGDVSPKLDVYSFGVVLFEIVSAKEAIVRTAGDSTNSSTPRREEQRGLVTLFDEVLKDANGKEKLWRLVDPALGDNYPLESVWKMTQLAGACTQENPELRPSMRTAVVALMTLSSSTQEWEMGDFESDSIMRGLVSGR